MKSSTAILTVKLLGDNQTGKAFKEAQSQAQKFEKNLDKAAGVATGALVGLAAAGTGAALAAEAVATANATVGNVLGNMGMDKATDRVLAYADALEKSLGIDEKTIKATQGKLATFSELASSADTAGGAFDRATMAALDMAAAGFGTAEQNAVQLGKALQDPVKGITALQRSGVTFTQAQKDMIAAMVESGDTAGAQNLILAELEKQVGGTAEATADSSAKMKLAFGEVAEQMGTALLPAMDALAGYAQKFAEWAGENTGLLTGLAAAVGGLAATVVAVNTALKVYNAIALVVRAATAAWSAAQIVLNVALIANPIGLIVAAVAALIAVIVAVAYFTRDKWIPAVKAMWEWVKRAAGAIRDGLGGAFDWIKGKIASAIEAVKKMIQWLRDLARKAKEALSNLNPFKGGFFGGLFGRAAIAPGARAGTAAATRQTITVSTYSDPQAQAREIARILTGARIRTGFTGIPA